MPRRSAAAVAETRAAVTESAAKRASVEGLEGLTIGGLADQMEMRKAASSACSAASGSCSWRSWSAAIEQFRQEVWEAAAERPPGRRRLLALCDAWLSYHEREVMPGGCFLTTATIEYDARPGPLRDAIAETMRRWLETLEREAQAAIDAGELPADANAADIAFELNALAAAASYGFQLWRDPEVFAKARRAMRRALGAPLS